eukprot:TRINITY_DN7063_c0_g1_i1.p1 TRINITY_DN7063_c0_g1~~TRINITY_DN7063_c0_g1_i1.p1  ORF type:complete len:469 (-),score=143.13 TRINITY_DN7063_c0_g1_i1:147-1553(-)
MPSPTNTSSEGSSKTPPPSLVGTLFVRKFYTMMSTLPDQLHRFYKDDSTFSYGTEGESIESFVGDQEINKKILSLDYKNTNVLISSLEAQQSLKGGMIVLVSGSFNNESGSRQFTETFFLATQPAGFYVLNDIRLLKPAAVATTHVENGVEQAAADESDALAESTEALESPKEPENETASEPVAPATPEPTPAPAPAPVETPATPTPAPTPAPATPSPTSAAPTPASTPVTPAPATSAAPTTPSQPVTASPAVTSKPSSFLSAVQSGSAPSVSQASTNVAQAPKQNPKTAKNPAPARKPAQQPHDPDASSVFVRNLPHAVDQQVKELEQKLRELFSHQGTIKNINTGFLQRGYCFVEFESPEIAQRCIKAAEGGHLQIDGKALMVEEKKASPATKSDSGSKVTGSASGSRPGGPKPNIRTGDRVTGSSSSSSVRSRGGSTQGSDAGARRPAKANPKQQPSQAAHANQS